MTTAHPSRPLEPFRIHVVVVCTVLLVLQLCFDRIHGFAPITGRSATAFRGSFCPLASSSSSSWLFSTKRNDVVNRLEDGTLVSNQPKQQTQKGKPTSKHQKRKTKKRSASPRREGPKGKNEANYADYIPNIRIDGAGALMGKEQTAQQQEPARTTTTTMAKTRKGTHNHRVTGKRRTSKHPKQKTKKRSTLPYSRRREGPKGKNETRNHRLSTRDNSARYNPDRRINGGSGAHVGTAQRQLSTNPARTVARAKKDPNNHQRAVGGERPNDVPWRASYAVSIQTQDMLKRTHQRFERSSEPTRQATAVLKALLDTPPHLCNSANLVCALTLSAKSISRSDMVWQETQPRQLRQLILKALDVLHDLVHKEALHARQLCNSIHAVAKLYLYDPSILPTPSEPTVVSSSSDSSSPSPDQAVGYVESWRLPNDDNEEVSPQRRVEQTLDRVARQLSVLLTEPSPGQQQQKGARRKPKLGEISMASWAFAVLRRRNRPAGWSSPPQLSRLPSSLHDRNDKRDKSNRPDKKTLPKRDPNVVTFESWTERFSTMRGSSLNDDSDEEEGLGVGSDEAGGYQDPVFAYFDAVATYLITNTTSSTDGQDIMLLQDLAWNNVALIGWAFAINGHCRTQASEQFMRELAREAVHRLESASGSIVSARDITQLTWSIATLQSDNFRLGGDLAVLVNAIAKYWRVDRQQADEDQLPRRAGDKRWGIGRCSNAGLVQLCAAMANGRIDHLPLLRAAFQESLQRLLTSPNGANKRFEEFQPWEVCILLWVLARLHLKEKDGLVFSDFAEAAPRWLLEKASTAGTLRDVGIGRQEQANFAWAMTVLDGFTDPHAVEVLKQVFAESAEAAKQDDFFQLEHAHQLWQALFLLEKECPQVDLEVPNWFRQFLSDSWSVEKSRRKISSARHKSLSQTLDLMGITHYNEHDEDIDVAIILKSDARWTSESHRGDHTRATAKIAVEFDGPNHFTRELPGAEEPFAPRALGHTVLKYRLLKHQGWAVVRVPYYEFDKIPFWASMERQRYLQRLLKTHANIRFSDADVSEYKAIVPNRQSRFD